MEELGSVVGVSHWVSALGARKGGDTKGPGGQLGGTLHSDEDGLAAATAERQLT